MKTAPVGFDSSISHCGPNMNPGEKRSLDHGSTLTRHESPREVVQSPPPRSAAGPWSRDWERLRGGPSPPLAPLWPLPPFPAAGAAAGGRSAPATLPMADTQGGGGGNPRPRPSASKGGTHQEKNTRNVEPPECLNLGPQSGIRTYLPSFIRICTCLISSRNLTLFFTFSGKLCF